MPLQIPKTGFFIFSASFNKAISKTSLFGKENRVNSYHHMAIKDVAKDFKVTSKAPDGIVESIEYTKDSFMIGVQFHPEMLSLTHEPSQKLFNELIKKAQA